MFRGYGLGRPRDRKPRADPLELRGLLGLSSDKARIKTRIL